MDAIINISLTEKEIEILTKVIGNLQYDYAAKLTKKFTRQEVSRPLYKLFETLDYFNSQKS